jgi:hypothetical protein
MVCDPRRRRQRRAAIGCAAHASRRRGVRGVRNGMQSRMSKTRITRICLNLPFARSGTGQAIDAANVLSL